MKFLFNLFKKGDKSTSIFNSSTDGSVFLILSIKKIHADKILNGTKKFEFRKQIPKLTSVSNVVFLYCTKPTGKILGYYTYKNTTKITSDNVDIFYKQNRNKTGLTRLSFFDYFGENQSCYAMEIDTVVKFPTPIKYEDVIPQNFIYISSLKANKLLSEGGLE